jgi:hypothetical protein
MQKQNFQEYVALRREIDSIKKCVTDYMGFLILGIGAAFSVWGTIGAKSSDNYNVILPLGYSSLAISLVVVFMLLILIYKFISHNRYVGYCILLTQEIWDEECKTKHDIDSLMLWELCVNQLRVKEVIGSAKILEEHVAFNQQYKIIDTEPSPSTISTGLWFLFKALFRFQKSASWGFPLTIVRIFVVVVWSCVVFGIYALYPTICMGTFGWHNESTLALGFLGIVVISQILLWLNIATKIHSIMMGSSTVTSFAERFRPVRKQALEEVYEITAQWKGLTNPYKYYNNNNTHN